MATSPLAWVFRLTTAGDSSGLMPDVLFRRDQFPGRRMELLPNAVVR
jgi:hypothetical protein